MSTNYTVSSDVDTMLRSATNAHIRSNIGAGSDTQVNSNATNIASIGVSVNSNTADIATLQTEIDTKAPKNNPDFTGTAEFDGFVDIEESLPNTPALRVTGELRHTGDYNCVGSLEVANGSTPPTIKLQDRECQY